MKSVTGRSLIAVYFLKLFQEFLQAGHGLQRLDCLAAGLARTATR
jgi:hypothetical protein